MKIARYILAVIVGFIAGQIVNGSLIAVSGRLIPPPSGADMTTLEGIKAAMPMLEPKHFIMPFLAHSLGTFAMAFVAAIIAPAHKMKFALAMGVLGLAGGVAAVFMIPAPLWYDIVDLVGAYIPFAYLAGMLAPKNNPEGA